jgi:hypothetical protein
MKFVCIRCDEGMKLERVEAPEDDGSLGVVFACAACGNRVAMLTNPWETQLVRALDVRIGGRSSPVEPMEFVRSMLASGREARPDAASPSQAASGTAPSSGCPFSAMANLAAELPAGTPAHFTQGVPGTRHSGTQEIAWSPEAERRLERVPEFIRPMVRQGIERLAAERGYQHITEDIMDEIRNVLGM